MGTRSYQHGFSLVEISVVLAIMVAFAGMVTPYLAETVETSMCVATDNTLLNIRNAIMGGSTSGGYRNDMGGMPSAIGASNPWRPGVLSELLSPQLLLPSNRVISLEYWDPVTSHGWNGPYLTGGKTCNTFPESTACAGLSCDSVPSQGRCEQPFVMDSYSVSLGFRHDRRDPIELRVTPDNIHYLISGGYDGLIQVTNLAERSALDDRVLILDGTDPGSNRPCNQ